MVSRGGHVTIDEFTGTLESAAPPGGVAPALAALWHDARGDWNRAHEIAQEVPDPEGAWVHAYLHRKEGDAGNAAYWYRRAGKPVARETLEEEWRRIAAALLEG
jgi:hypothetical protein